MQNIVIVILVALLITVIYVVGSSEEMRDAINNFVMKERLTAHANFSAGTVTIAEEPVGTIVTADFTLPPAEYSLVATTTGATYNVGDPFELKDATTLLTFAGDTVATGESRVTLRGNRNVLGRTLVLVEHGHVVDSAHVVIASPK